MEAKATQALLNELIETLKDGEKGYADAMTDVEDTNLKETFKKKINVDFRNYRILGACNPMLAHEALKLEDKVGTMLPCNVVVQDVGGGRTEVAAIDPVASMQAIDNTGLKRAAEQVGAKLKKFIDAL